MNNIWYHGTPDVRELQEEGGFTQRYIDIDYVDDIDGWKSTQDAMKLARESGNDEEYFELLKKAGTFRKKAKIRKPVFLTNVYSVAKTYADPQRAFDYQNSIEKVLKVKTKEGGKGVTISAPGSRFRFIDINNVKRGFLDAGVDVNDLDLAIEKLNFAVGVDSGIKTNSIAALADWLGFDYVDVVGVLDSYHGGSTKSTVRMVMDPNNIDIVRDGINESLRGFIRGVIRESLDDNISNSKIAYHVSPFKFDKFDFSKVGSREMAHRKKTKDVGMFFSQDQWSIDWMKNLIRKTLKEAYDTEHEERKKLIPDAIKQASKWTGKPEEMYQSVEQAEEMEDEAHKRAENKGETRIYSAIKMGNLNKYGINFKDIEISVSTDDSQSLFGDNDVDAVISGKGNLMSCYDRDVSTNKITSSDRKLPITPLNPKKSKWDECLTNYKDVKWDVLFYNPKKFSEKVISYLAKKKGLKAISIWDENIPQVIKNSRYIFK